MVIFSISENKINNIKNRISSIPVEYFITFISVFLAISAILVALNNSWIIAYGDSQSHLNISKRVVDNLTPGFAQLGAIWLPLPHLLMVPFVKIELLYRTGLAGSIVSSFAFIVSCFFVYKLIFEITKNKLTSFIGFIVFATNPNMLYLQTTALTEPLLVCFMLLSTYFFIKFLKVAVGKEQNRKALQHETIDLIYAAFFGFCATLTRYDGWFLVAFEAFIIMVIFSPIILEKGRIKFRKLYLNKLQGLLLLFSTFAFLGILIWLIWGGLIVGDPFYFTHSDYSAKSQQLVWLSRGQLPAYHNILLSISYYLVDSLSNIGVIIFGVSAAGIILFVKRKRNLFSILVVLLLLFPFFFNVLTLFIGQSVIFLPHFPDPKLEWHLFNARYGVLMLPAAAFFFAMVFYYAKYKLRLLLLLLILIQFGLFLSGYSKVISFADGVEGLSASKVTDADIWMKKNYDGGLVLMDDFSRSINIIYTDIPMQNTIYVGNKPYWEESLKDPNKYANWVIVQKNDEVWKNLYSNPARQKDLYKHFVKVYTSPELLIFKKNERDK